MLVLYVEKCLKSKAQEREQNITEGKSANKAYAAQEASWESLFL